MSEDKPINLTKIQKEYLADIFLKTMRLEKENANLKNEMNCTNNLHYDVIIKLQQENATLKQEMATQTEQYTEDNRKLQNQIKKLNEKIEALMNALDWDTEEIKAFQEQIVELEKKLKEAGKE